MAGVVLTKEGITETGISFAAAGKFLAQKLQEVGTLAQTHAEQVALATAKYSKDVVGKAGKIAQAAVTKAEGAGKVASKAVRTIAQNGHSLANGKLAFVADIATGPVGVAITVAGTVKQAHDVESWAKDYKPHEYKMEPIPHSKASASWEKDKVALTHVANVVAPIIDKHRPLHRLEHAIMDRWNGTSHGNKYKDMHAETSGQRHSATADSARAALERYAGLRRPSSNHATTDKSAGGEAASEAVHGASKNPHAQSPNRVQTMQQKMHERGLGMQRHFAPAGPSP